MGTVKDGSGGVLPGVAVEATSPALIEKVRTTITDAEGLYRIVDLRPGTYAVTFALPGFSTLKREGVELTAGFTRTVNGELTVSNLEETITVTGQTPLIDSQNVTQRRAMTSVIIDALLTAKTFQSISTLVPGVRTPISSQDVGGLAGQSWQVLSVHGSRADQMPINHDGMPYNNMNNTGGGYNTDIQLNSGMIQATTCCDRRPFSREQSERRGHQYHSQGGGQRLPRLFLRETIRTTSFRPTTCRPGSSREACQPPIRWTKSGM